MTSQKHNKISFALGLVISKDFSFITPGLMLFAYDPTGHWEQEGKPAFPEKIRWWIIYNTEERRGQIALNSIYKANPSRYLECLTRFPEGKENKWPFLQKKPVSTSTFVCSASEPTGCWKLQVLAKIGWYHAHSLWGSEIVQVHAIHRLPPRFFKHA